MAKAPDGPAPISEESIAYLEEVKKGKPRKFAMICKGTAVISLVVYKKGNVEKRRKEAKESGKGQFYFGVVDGKGMDLRFVLARADGFESPPVKSASLKGFLDESAELKCKPYFEIVDTVPFVLDEDNPLVVRFLKLQEVTLQACEAHPDRAAEINTLCRQIGSYLDQDQPDQATVNLDTLETLLGGLRDVPSSTAASPTVDDGLAAKLVEGLKNLKPLLEKAITQHPSRKSELFASFTQVRDEIKSQRLTQAQADLDGLEKLLQSLQASPTTSNPEDKPQLSDEMVQWKEKVAAWGPAIKTAIAAKGPNAAEMMKLLAQASALSKPGGNIAEAIVKLTECHALVGQGATKGDPGALFNERLKAMLPSIKAAIGTPAGDAAKLKVSEAGVSARKKDFDGANELLTQAEQLLGQGKPQATAEVALAGWQNARITAIAQLTELADAIMGYEHPQADQAFVRCKAIQANLTEKPETLQGVMELETYLESDEIVAAVEGPNGFGIDVNLRQPLLEALGKLKPLLSA